MSASPDSPATTRPPPPQRAPLHGPTSGPGDASAMLARVARGSVANLAGAVVSALCSFALAVVITHGMSRVDAGVFFSVTSLFLVATSIGQLGTDSGLVYFISRARRFGQLQLVRSYLRAAADPVVITALLMSVGMLVLAGPLGELTNPHHATLAAHYLRILALFIVPSGVETVLLSATRGLGFMAPNVAVEQVGRQCLQLVLVGVAVAAAGTRWLAVAWAVPYLAAVATAWWCWQALRRRTVDPAGAAGPLELVSGHAAVATRARGRHGRPNGLARTFWGFTAPRSLASVAQLLMQRIDIVLVGALAGPVQAAIFTAATRFVVAGQFSRSAVSLAVQPALAEALTDDDLRTARRLYRTSAGWLSAVAWPLYLTFCVSGHDLLSVFGHGYGQGATILVLVSLGMLVATGCGDVDSVLVMGGRTSTSLTNMALGLGVMIGLDLWLIPGHGAVGAAVGWGVAAAVKNTAGLLRVWMTYRFNPFGRATITALALTTACFGGLQYAAEQLPVSLWARLGVGLTASTVSFVVSAYLLRGPLELTSLRSFTRRGQPVKDATKHPRS